ncbi:MAG: branched-chain amino acid ABC transporter permease [Candidatus Pacearchaeota archaeon]
MIESYLVHLLILVGIYIILGLSLQLTIGYTGLLNLGHVAFYSIGAYTSALLVVNGMPFFVGILAAGIIAMASGFLLSIPIKKIKAEYLALATLGFAFVVHSIAVNWNKLTNGPLGISGIPSPTIFGLSLSNNTYFLVFVIIIAFATYLIINKLVDSPFGKVLESIRDNETASKSLGKNTAKVKAISLGASAFFAGIAGSLYAHYISYIDPSSFTIMQLIPIISIVIIGGLASIRGTILASFLIVLLPEPLRFIGFPSSIVGPARQIMYALILLVILIFKPKGFYGKVKLG